MHVKEKMKVRNENEFEQTFLHVAKNPFDYVAYEHRVEK